MAFGVGLATLAFLGLAHAAEKRAGDEPPSRVPRNAPTWAWPPRDALRVHAVRGQGDDLFRLDAALARAGVAFVTESWHLMDDRFKGADARPNSYWSAISSYPETPGDLTRCHAIIVCNVNGRAFQQQRQLLLKDYVSHGGAVLFLGGRYAFGPEYRGTALEEMAPVAFEEQIDLGHAPAGLVLAPGPDKAAKGLKGLSWADRPRVFWYHRVTPKETAKVLVTAGGKPLLIVHEFGKGRAAVFAGSVMGEPLAGALPFWQWKDWPEMTARTLEWLLANAGTNDPAEAMRLRARLDATPVGDGSDRALPALRTAARNCRDTVTAKLILKMAASHRADLPADLTDELHRATWPYVDARFDVVAKQLIASGLEAKAALGLRALGRAKSPDAVESLKRHLATGRIEPPAGADEEAQAAMLAASQDAALTVRLAALEGLGDLGDSRLLPFIKEQSRRFESGRFPDNYSPGDAPNLLTPDHELYQEALLTRLRCGDETVAGALVDALMENCYIISRQRSIRHLPEPLQRAMDEALPRTMARQEFMLEKLRTAPESTWPALAHRIAAEKDCRVTPIALAVFGGRRLPEGVREELRKSGVEAVRELGKAH